MERSDEAETLSSSGGEAEEEEAGEDKPARDEDSASADDDEGADAKERSDEAETRSSSGGEAEEEEAEEDGSDEMDVSSGELTVDKLPVEVEGGEITVKIAGKGKSAKKAAADDAAPADEEDGPSDELDDE